MSSAAAKNVAITIVLSGAQYPKLAKMMASQAINNTMSAVGIDPPAVSIRTQRCRTTRL